MVNNPPKHGSLFAFRTASGHSPLTKLRLLNTLKRAADKAWLTPLKGHSIRVGAKLEYLLRGTPFDVVRATGRWASDSFILYLRKHAQILARFLEQQPLVHDAYLRYEMPPVRRPERR